ncbi:PREDICTED: translation initiation factor IF-2-like [Chinchilla lanigera]|uniref:translation initiation factor IF-2-like n=1 Tax=Chinchilla lanigera TaxID=34839 RepID=UPI00038F17CD|nr:PREDICTED: translation initiation factor IF-2-like [Chinchilla lanigera]
MTFPLPKDILGIFRSVAGEGEGWGRDGCSGTVRARQVPPQTPRSGAGRRGWQAGSRAAGSPRPDSRLPPARAARLLTPLCLCRTSAAPRRCGQRMQVSATGRRHREGQARRADPRFRVPSAGGDPRGGRREGSGQSRGGTARDPAPRGLGAPSRAFLRPPPNCCRRAPSPFRVPGNLAPGASPAAGAGAGRRRGRREPGSFVMQRRPPGSRDRGPRPGGKQMECGQTIRARGPPPPPAPRAERRCPDLQATPPGAPGRPGAQRGSLSFSQVRSWKRFSVMAVDNEREVWGTLIDGSLKDFKTVLFQATGDLTGTEDAHILIPLNFNE